MLLGSSGRVGVTRGRTMRRVAARAGGRSWNEERRCVRRRAVVPWICSSRQPRPRPEGGQLAVAGPPGDGPGRRVRETGWPGVVTRLITPRIEVVTWPSLIGTPCRDRTSDLADYKVHLTRKQAGPPRTRRAPTRRSPLIRHTTSGSPSAPGVHDDSNRVGRQVVHYGRLAGTRTQSRHRRFRRATRGIR